MFRLRENETVINRLSVKESETDVLSLRMRFERLFGTGGYLPAGLPPQAVICIKRLRDPAPRTLNFNQHDSGFSDAWKKAVANEVEKLFRRAVRPVIESVPAQAQSIIFMDKAELLACLADDWCEGSLSQNWWWKCLFPNLDQAKTVAQIWLQSAEYAPIALKILVKKQNAVEFVSKLQAVEVENLLQKIIETFGLNKLQNVLFSNISETEKSVYRNTESEKQISKLRIQSPDIFFQNSELLLEVISEIKFKTLTLERKILLAVGLYVARSPRIARSAQFAAEIRKLKVESFFFQNLEIPKTETYKSDQQTKFANQFETFQETPAIAKEKKPQINFSKPENKNQETGQAVKNEKSSKQKTELFFNKPESPKKPKKVNSESLSKPESKIKKLKQAQNNFKEINIEKTKIVKSSDLNDPENELKHSKKEREENYSVFTQKIPQKTENEQSDLIIHSHFGGVFYLLNLGLYLKLYRDFSEPSGEEIDLNIWDFVALLSCEFLGEKIKNDPVWSFLKRLAGRDENEDFGQDFSSNGEWRISTDWLKTFPANGKWCWSNIKDRLIVCHSENFCVIDVKINDSENQLEHELKIYEGFLSEVGKVKIKDFSRNFKPSQRWLKHLYEFAECRLLQSLNLETREELNEILFEESATVTVSETHFNATFSLADLPLQVRFSGLDRDPGWIPAAGKYVEFHFV